MSKQKYFWNFSPDLHDAGIHEDIAWMLDFTVSEITSRGEASFTPPACSHPGQLTPDLHADLDTRKLY